MKHTNKQFADKLLGDAVTGSALKVAEMAAYLARAENAKISSFHFLFGILSSADTSASALLQINGCDLHKLKRLFSEEKRANQSGFSDEFPMSSCSQDARNLLDTSRVYAEHSRDLGINTVHLLLGLYQPKMLSSEFLHRNSPSQRVVADLEKLIQAQDKRDLEG